MKSNKKYNFIIEAKNTITNFVWCRFNSTQLNASDIKELVLSCKNKTLKKYVKHVLRCGSFYEDMFYMPSTRECMESKVKNRPMTFEYAE